MLLLATSAGFLSRLSVGRRNSSNIVHLFFSLLMIPSSFGGNDREEMVKL